MKKALIYFGRNHPIALGTFSLASLVAIILATRFLLDVIYFNDPNHRDEALKPWMTPRYVGMSYQLPKNYVREMFDLQSMEGKPPSMRRIAEEKGMSLDELDAYVRQSAEAFRKTKGQSQ